MRVVLALDKFKGTFSAQEACELLAEGIRHRNPKIETIIRPMADGGEATASILGSSMGLETMRVHVPDLLGKSAEAHIHWHNARRLAVIESAEILGISRTIVAHETALQTSSTVGLGKLIQKALELRPLEVWICVGGTMTADAGWGVAHAFGLTALDENGHILTPSLENMGQIAQVVLPEPTDLLKKTRIIALCDVNAPAIGNHLSLSSFLAQKGADLNSIDEIRRRITLFWGFLKEKNSALPTLEAAFMGAGGGLCIGLSAIFPNFKMELGAQKVAQATALKQCLGDVDLVVCGEGCLDEQSLYGKAPSIVSHLASDHQTRSIGVFGKVVGNESILKEQMGLSEIIKVFESVPQGKVDIVRMTKIRFHEIGGEIANRLEKI